MKKFKKKLVDFFTISVIFLGILIVLPSSIKVYAQEFPEISVEQAKNKIEERFAKYNVTELEYLEDEYKNQLLTYKFQISLGEKDPFCIYITKQGGFIITLGCILQTSINLLENDCITAVEQYIKNIGINDVEAIWSTTLQDERIINLAPVKESVIIYPDLIKVRVNCKTGTLKSVETRPYLYEYKGDIEGRLKPSITFEEAKKQIDESFNILDHRLAIILHPEKTMTLIYEIKAEKDGFTYYYYIDANTGELYYVLPSTE